MPDATPPTETLPSTTAPVESDNPDAPDHAASLRNIADELQRMIGRLSRHPDDRERHLMERVKLDVIAGSLRETAASIETLPQGAALPEPDDVVISHELARELLLHLDQDLDAARADPDDDPEELRDQRGYLAAAILAADDRFEASQQTPPHSGAPSASAAGGQGPAPTPRPPEVELVWTRTPDYDGHGRDLFWHWSGDPQHAPVPLSISRSGFTGKLFVMSGQYGIRDAIDVDDYGGWWTPVREPAIPDEYEDRCVGGYLGAPGRRSDQ